MLPESLVFKVDVEGYEPYVLLGMKNTINGVKNAFGFAEFDSGFLKKSGWTADKYQDEALFQFDLYVPVKKNSTQFKKITSLADYCQQRSKTLKPGKSIHFDLLLIKKGSDITLLPKDWSL